MRTARLILDLVKRSEYPGGQVLKALGLAICPLPFGCPRLRNLLIDHQGPVCIVDPDTSDPGAERAAM